MWSRRDIHGFVRRVPSDFKPRLISFKTSRQQILLPPKVINRTIKSIVYLLSLIPSALFQIYILSITSILVQSTLGPYVVQIWPRHPSNLEETKCS